MTDSGCIEEATHSSGIIMVECLPGFIFKDGICNALEKYPIHTLPGCVLVDETTNECLACEDNFVLINETCLAEIDFCTLYDLETGQCLQCEESFTLTNDSTCAPPVLDPFCHEFQGTECVKCSRGYHLSSTSECVPIDPLCK